MIVDNHDLFANTLKDSLAIVLGEKFKNKDIALNFELYPSAEEGILAIKNEKNFDVIMSDVNLGEGLNGFKFIEVVHSFIDPQHSDKCLWILMSSNNSEIYKDEAKKWAAFFLPKVELGLFTKAICQYIEMKCEASVCL